jgi:HSP20 family protein
MAHIVRRTTPELAHLSHLDPLQIMRDLAGGWDPFRQMTTFTPYVTHPLVPYAPQFEVKETKDAFIFKADLPGVEEKNIDVSLTGNRLTVSGLREEEDRSEAENFFADERVFGSFTRAFTLPDGVEGDQVSAELKGGVLTLNIPKKPEHQPKKISIKVAEKVKGVFSKEKGTA